MIGSRSTPPVPNLCRPPRLPTARERAATLRTVSMDFPRKVGLAPLAVRHSGLPIGEPAQSTNLRLERATAAAGGLHMRIIELEARSLERLHVVDLGAVQVQHARLIH